MNAQLSFLAGAISLAITSFSDDIPTGKTISCLIEAMTFDDEVITLTVTEPLDWSYANPRCWIQFQDGRPSTRLLTPTRVDDFTLSIPYNDDLHPEDWTMDDPDIELPRLLFCDSEKGARHGIVQEIVPRMTAPVRSPPRNIKKFSTLRRRHIPRRRRVIPKTPY
jgi:hypothetical protein